LCDCLSISCAIVILTACFLHTCVTVVHSLFNRAATEWLGRATYCLCFQRQVGLDVQTIENHPAHLPGAY